MEFRVLGPLEVISGGRCSIWGDDPPGNPSTSLRAYLSNLRKVLEPNRAEGSTPSLLLRRSNGYVLAIDPAQVDGTAFVDKLARARTETGEARLQLVEQALARWRGDAFVEADENQTAPIIASRLNEQRREALLFQATGLLDLGRAQEAVAVLQTATKNDPYDETLQAQLALALYHAGRQTEALRSIDAARNVLADELGLDPGPVLIDVETRILNHDIEPLAPADRPSPAASTDVPSHPDRQGLLVGLITRRSMARLAVALRTSYSIGCWCPKRCCGPPAS